MYAVYTSCAKLCGCWVVPRLSYTSIPRCSLGIRLLIHKDCIRMGDLSKSVYLREIRAEFSASTKNSNMHCTRT